MESECKEMMTRALNPEPVSKYMNLNKDLIRSYWCIHYVGAMDSHLLDILQDIDSLFLSHLIKTFLNGTEGTCATSSIPKSID